MQKDGEYHFEGLSREESRKAAMELISKLECRANGKTILNYDRGWDMEPETELGYQAYAILTEKFN